MRLLHAWFDYRELRRVGKGIRAAPQATRTVPLAQFKPWPGPVYVELGAFRSMPDGNLFRLAFCESCGTVVYADTPHGPVTSGVHDNWHRRYC